MENITGFTEAEVVSSEIKPAPIDTISLEVAKMAEPLADGLEKIGAREKIAAIKAKYSALTIASPEDKAGYKAVKEAIAHTRSLRVKIRDKHKELKEDSLKLGRALDKEKNELISLLEEIENPLQYIKDDIDQAAERAKRELELQEAARLSGRIEEIKENGMKYDGLNYVLGALRIDAVILRVMSDQHYADFLTSLKKENEAVIQAEKERIEKEAAEKAAIEAQRQENERIQKEQEEKEQQLKLEREALAKEKEELRLQRINSRIHSLQAQGFEYDEHGKYIFIRRITDETLEQAEVSVTDIHELVEEKWQMEYNRAMNFRAALLSDHNKYLAEKEAQRKAEKEAADAELERRRLEKEEQDRRMFQLTSLGMRPSSQYQSFVFEDVNVGFVDMQTLDAGEWENLITRITPIIAERQAARLKKMQEDAEKEAKEQEEARKAALSAEERLREYVKDIRQLATPIVEFKRVTSRIAVIDNAYKVFTEALINLENSLKK